jgi:predicted phosphodiesterase
MAKTSPTRFLVLSDTHDVKLDAEANKAALRRPFPKIDVLLHCGDLT